MCVHFCVCVCISVCVCAFLCVRVHAHAPPPPLVSFHSLTLLFTLFCQFSCSSVAVKNISLTVTYIAILATTRTVPVHASSPQAGPSDSPANPELRDLQPLITVF